MDNSITSQSAFVSAAEKTSPSGGYVTSNDLGSVSALADWLRVRLGSQLIDQWGILPGTKPVANLWLELCQGEIVLEDLPNNPRRTLNVACVTVTNPSRDLMLVESHQAMGDGSVRERNKPLAEKMKPGESVEDACFRGIREELGPVLGNPQNVSLMHNTYTKVVEERKSNTYLGLLTCYVLHKIEATIRNLPEHDFVTDENELCDDIYDCTNLSFPSATDLDVASEDDNGSNVNAAHNSDDQRNDAGSCHNTINNACADLVIVGTKCTAVEPDHRNVTVSSKGENEGAAIGVKRHFWKWIPVTST